MRREKEIIILALLLANLICMTQYFKEGFQPSGPPDSPPPFSSIFPTEPQGVSTLVCKTCPDGSQGIVMYDINANSQCGCLSSNKTLQDFAVSENEPTINIMYNSDAAHANNTAYTNATTTPDSLAKQASTGYSTSTTNGQTKFTKTTQTSSSSGYVQLSKECLLCSNNVPAVIMRHKSTTSDYLTECGCLPTNIGDISIESVSKNPAQAGIANIIYSPDAFAKNTALYLSKNPSEAATSSISKNPSEAATSSNYDLFKTKYAIIGYLVIAFLLLIFIYSHL